MKNFSKILGNVLKRPSWLSVPEFILKIALGEMATMLIYGQKVIPNKVIRSGFVFQYPKLKSALEDILV